MDTTHTDALWQEGRGAGIFHATFRILAIADLYGPKRAIEWARTLLDDPELFTAFAAPRRPVTDIAVRRLRAPAEGSPTWN